MEDERSVIEPDVRRRAGLRNRAQAVVHLGRVDERHAEFDAEAEGLELELPTAPVFCHVPRALPERWDRFTGWKVERPHIDLGSPRSASARVRARKSSLRTLGTG